MTAEDLPSSRRRRREIVLLPMDMMEEILTRLPVKHVLRCKLLSKTYYNLIQKQSFINKHRLHHRFDPRVVVVTKNLHDRVCNRLVSTLSASDSPVFSPPLTGASSKSNYTVLVGSCNGLLVLRSHDDFTICNPATREYMSLPRPTGLKAVSHSRVLGFGYDAKYDDYVMVDIRHSLPNRKPAGPQSYWIETWNMSTNTWKQIQNPSIPSLFSGKHYQLSSGCFVVGTLCWLAYTIDRTSDDDGGDATILTFDLSYKTFGQMALPKEVARRRDIYNLSLVDFMGSLAFCIRGLPFGESHRWFDIWVLKKEDESSFWTRRFEIGPFPLEVRTIRRVCVDGNFVLSRTIGLLSGYVTPSELILYDPRRNELVKEATHNDFSAFGSVCSVTESLVRIRRKFWKQ